MFAFTLIVGLLICSSQAFGHRFSRPRRDQPPPVDEAAKMARYIVHKGDWCVLSHITHQRNATGYPMGRFFSTSDGLPGMSTGTLYFYTSDLDGVARDLKNDTKCAITMSLLQTGYCQQQKLDPENPRCAQVMMIGNYIHIQNGTEEWNFAKNALFSRHPEMDTWPKTHDFQFGKFAPSNVQIVDYFGGSKYPTVPEYFAADPLKATTEPAKNDDSFLNNIYRVVHIRK